jgi:hypothetical protein
MIVFAILLAAGCGGGGGPGPVGTTTPPSGSPTLGPSPITAFANGCHRTRQGEVELLVRFDLGSSPLLGALHEGEKFGFRGSVVSPATWSTTGQAPVVTVHPHSYINHLVIPQGEPLPPLLTFHIDVFLERRVAVTVGHLDQLSGRTLHGPFGTYAVSGAERSGGDIVVTLGSQGSANLPAGFGQLGPRSATLTAGGKTVSGTIASVQPPASSVEIRFPGAPTSGSTTLSLTDWSISAPGAASYTGTPQACGNV